MTLLRRLLLLPALAAIALAVAAPADAAAGDIGYQDGGTGGGNPTGMKRPESVLWFANGFWWGNLWDTRTSDFHIFRLSRLTQTWADTLVATDTRSKISADTLWDGTRLYVSSHKQSSTAQAGSPSYLFRYSFDPVSSTYSPDPGFPVQINNLSTETLTIAKDSTGKLWATWMQADKIYVNRTTGDDRTWGTPFALPLAQANVTSDDISAVVAFGGDKIGIMWDNQASAQDGYWFSIHQDGQPDTAWSAPEGALTGARTADDHINLKAGATGRVYAAIKTSHTSDSQPLTMLLVRNPSTGAWSRHTVDTVAGCPNRPIAVIDEAAGVAHVFETAPGPPDFVCTADGGDIYEKTTSLSSISFGSGMGTPVLQPAATHRMNNVSSTKQLVNASTGLVVIAPELQNDFYWHNLWTLGTPAPPQADFTGTPTTGDAPLNVAFSDRSTGSPNSWSWDFGDGGASTVQNPTHIYAAAGTYSVGLTVANASGTNTVTKTGYITAGTPVPVTTLTFAPVADTRVEEATPTTNYGTSGSLRAKHAASNSYRSFLRFSVSGVSAPVRSATLRLFVTSDSASGGSISPVAGTWSESTTTWSNAPAVTQPPVATAGSAPLGTWVEFALTSAVTGSGTYDFALTTALSDSVYYNSRQGTNPPQLVLTQG